MTSASANSLKDQAYSQIRQRIEQGDLNLGDRVSTRELSKVLDMSSIPIREAITQLVSEGFIEHRPGIGTFVKNPTRQEIQDVYELRILLESYAAKRAAEYKGEEGLTEMRQAVELMHEIRKRLQRHESEGGDELYEGHWGTADAAFHIAVFRRAGNQQAVRTMTNLRLMTRIFTRRAAAGRVRNLDVIIEHHEKIMDAIERHDAREAARLMRRHIRGGCIDALTYFDRQTRTDSDSNTQVDQVMEAMRQSLHDIREEH